MILVTVRSRPGWDASLTQSHVGTVPAVSSASLSACEEQMSS